MVLRKTKFTRIFWVLFLILGLYNTFLAGLNISKVAGLGDNNYLMGGLFLL